MRLYSIILVLVTATSAVAQDQDSSRWLSTVDGSLSLQRVKENLFRGLVHEGVSVGLSQSNRVQDRNRLFDWNIGLAAGIVLWNGAMTVSASGYPIDIGYTLRYAPDADRLKCYVGPYARLELTWNGMLQLDAQHPYWFTQHQIGVRHWLLWSIAEEKTLTLKTDISLLSLVSRPPEWRAYATYTLNFSDIISYMHERMKVASFVDALRFGMRLEYQVTFSGEIPMVYFFDFAYRRSSDPKPYQDVRQSFGISIPLFQQ